MNKVMYKKPMAETIQFENDDVITILSGYEFLNNCWALKRGTNGNFWEIEEGDRYGVLCNGYTHTTSGVQDDHGRWWEIKIWRGDDDDD